MTREDPGYGAIVVSFPDPPSISLDIRLGGGLEVTRVPWLRKVVSEAMKSWIKEEMLWPQRMLIPAEKPPSASGVGSGKSPKYVLTEKQLKAVLADDPLLKAEESLMSLKELEMSKVKNMKHEEEKSGVGVGVSGSADESEIDIEITDPSNPKPAPPSAQDAVWSWLKGASKVTVDKTLEVSKAAVEVSKGAVDTSVTFAQSQETKKALKDVGANVGKWWEKDVGEKVGGWWNNVATRATGGKARRVAAEAYPPADWWTGEGGEGAAAEAAEVEATAAEAVVAEAATATKAKAKWGSKKNGGSVGASPSSKKTTGKAPLKPR